MAKEENKKGSNFGYLPNGKMAMRLMYNPNTMMEVWGGNHDYINDIVEIYKNKFNQSKRSDFRKLYVDVNGGGYLSQSCGIGYGIRKLNSKETEEWKSKLTKDTGFLN